MTLRKLFPAFEAYLGDRRDLDKDLTEETVSKHLANARNYIIGGVPFGAHNRPKRIFKEGVADLTLNQLTPDVIKGWVRDVARTGPKKGTVGIILASLSVFIDFAKGKRYVAINHAESVGASGEPGRGVNVPPKDLVWEVVEYVHTRYPRYALAIAFAALTGLRAGEQWALLWCDIDFERGVVCITKKLSCTTGKIGAPKTEAGIREVPLPDPLLTALFELRSSTGAVQTDIVFPNTKGKRVCQQAFVRTFRNWCRAVLSSWPAEETFCIQVPRWHDLRHFAVSCWIEADLHVKTIATYAGHASVQTTLDIYGHLFKDRDHRAHMRKAMHVALGAADRSLALFGASDQYASKKPLLTLDSPDGDQDTGFS